MRHIHPYINAVPLDAHLGRDHWPTDDEYVALHRARDAVAAGGKGASYDVAVMHQVDQYARVFWDEKTGDIGSEIIEYRAHGARRIVKQWNGVPEKAPMTTNINKNTVIVNVPGQPQAGGTQHHHTSIDARQWHDGRQWHNTTHNHASAQGAAMPSRGPHYINAQPHNDFNDHWPTPEEAASLAEAKRQSDRLFAAGHRGTMNTARVRVSGGNGAIASVWRDAPQSYASFIQAPNPATASGWMTIKGWWGVPELVHRNPGGRVAVQAPADQVHYVPEDIHIVRQPRIHHHWQRPEHIHHGAPPTQTVEMEPAKVQVKRSAQRGFWTRVLLGPEKRQEPAPAHERHRGTLKTVEPSPAALTRQDASLALPAPTRQQLPSGASTQRQITHQPQIQLPAPAPRKRGLFSWR